MSKSRLKRLEAGRGLLMSAEHEEFISLLAKHNIAGLGRTRDEVLHALVSQAIYDLVKSEYVKKAMEMKRLLI